MAPELGYPSSKITCETHFAEFDYEDGGWAGKIWTNALLIIPGPVVGPGVSRQVNPEAALPCSTSVPPIMLPTATPICRRPPPISHILLSCFVMRTPPAAPRHLSAVVLFRVRLPELLPGDPSSGGGSPSATSSPAKVGPPLLTHLPFSMP